MGAFVLESPLHAPGFGIADPELVGTTMRESRGAAEGPGRLLAWLPVEDVHPSASMRWTAAGAWELGAT